MDLTPQDERACDHALGLLSEADEREYVAELVDPSPSDFELAAAELELALLGLGGERAEVALPASLEAKLHVAATAYGWALEPQPANQNAPRAVQRVDPRVDLGRYLGWMAAAVALIALGVVLSRQPESQVSGALPAQPPSATPTPDAGAPTAAPTPPERRASLLGREGTVTLDWSATKDEAAQGASGDVVWSTAQQEGYMRFKGLQPNDPERSQYQLWIFAKGQDERYPVDGGVFDVGSSGEVVVAIDPKIHVDAPTLFAITVEKPGGVVVSKRERIVLTAAAGG